MSYCCSPERDQHFPLAASLEELVVKEINLKIQSYWSSTTPMLIFYQFLWLRVLVSMIQIYRHRNAVLPQEAICTCPRTQVGRKVFNLANTNKKTKTAGLCCDLMWQRKLLRQQWKNYLGTLFHGITNFCFSSVIQKISTSLKGWTLELISQIQMGSSKYLCATCIYAPVCCMHAFI